MKNILLKRGLVCGIAVLFLGLCITSGTGVNVEQTIQPLSAGPTAWWEFDETSGTTAHDSSPHGYDGTVVGATWTGGGLDFDGSDDYVDFDAHSLALGMNKTDTYIVQVRFRSTGSGMLYSMSHTNPARAYYDLMIDEEGKLTVEMGDETCLFDLSTPSTYNDGDWYIVESNFEGDPTNPTLTLKVDGDEKATTTEWLCPMLDEDFITTKVGRNSNTDEDFFDGEIDDIKIYKNTPPPDDPPGETTINGPQEGDAGEELTYTFSAEDPEGQDVRFHIDWGDGDSETTVYVESGTAKAVKHTYNVAKTYTIKAYAEDVNNNLGPTKEFQVIIPRSKDFHTHPFIQFLQSHPNMFLILKYILAL